MKNDNSTESSNECKPMLANRCGYLKKTYYENNIK